MSLSRYKSIMFSLSVGGLLTVGLCVLLCGTSQVADADPQAMSVSTHRGDTGICTCVGTPCQTAPHTTDQATDGNTPVIFIPGSTFGTGSDRTFALAFGDADNDGDMDLAVGNHGPNQVCWNNGNGMFNCQDAFGGSATFDVEWGDVNNDGYLDLVVANSQGYPNLVCIQVTTTHAVTTTHTFTCTPFSTCADPVNPDGTDLCHVALGDVDCDGDLDIALGTRYVRNILAPDVVYYNNGDGTFPITRTVCQGHPTLELGFGDVDSDGDPDLAVVGHYSEYVCINSGNCTGIFAETRWLRWHLDKTTSGVAFGDADGDGDLDVAVGRQSYSNEVYLNDGSGDFREKVPFGPIWEHTWDVAWGDVDGDGDLDLAAGNYNGKTVVYFNDPVTDTNSITFTRQISLGTDQSHITSVAFGDVDGDGDLDLAVGSDGGQNVVYINAGDAFEPDDTCAQANLLKTDGTAQQHTFHQHADEDWARFDVISGTTYVVQVISVGPGADLELELYDTCDQPPLTPDDVDTFGNDARLVFTAPSGGDYYVRALNHDPAVYGLDVAYELSVRAQSPAPIVVIVAGRNEANQLEPNITFMGDQAYRTFRRAGVPRENIRYLSMGFNRDVDQDGVLDVDGAPTWENVRYAVQDWPRERGVRLGVPFYLYLVDHGGTDYYCAHGCAGGKRVSANDLNLWLSNLEAMTGADEINVIIEACYSGSFIDVTTVATGTISSQGRVVIASTGSGRRAFPSERGGYFSDAFFAALGDNADLCTAYETARAAVQAAWPEQTPWIDDNGDAVADEKDCQVARGRGLASFSGGSVPVVDWLRVGQVSESGAATVAAQVRDDVAVLTVTVEVYPPGLAVPGTGEGEMPVLPVDRLVLTDTDSSEVYETTYAGFTETGIYRLVAYARDDDGNLSLPRTVTVGEQKMCLPLVVRSD